MSAGRDHHRGGAALLIVLGVLVVCTTATTILLSAAANVKVHRELDQAEVLAFDMLDAAEPPIQHWLSSESARVVLPPEVRVPAVAVLHDAWSVDGEPVRLDIAAFDQLGMVPMQVARSGSPLRLAWPAEIARIIDRIELPSLSDGAPLGLDLIRAVESRTPVFPTPSADIEGGSIMGASVGGLVATHNRDPIRINMNTAPRALLESALRLGGRGDLQSILTARESGKSVAVESVPTPAHEKENSTRPRLVASSDCWAFRIDIIVGNLRRSWWAIYQHGQDDPRTPLRENWRCVQRLPIDQ